MNDKELLELAAKAAGYILTDGSRAMREFRCLGGVEWNPLEDDGDALRLAFNIGMAVDMGAMIITFGDDQPDEIEFNNHDGNIANVRRAIVRAAAEIGRNMQ